MSTPGSEASLFDRLGGVEGVSRLVVQFYSRVLSDPALRPYFHGVPLDKLQRMQLEFFSAALDGPLSYSGRGLQHAHQAHHIPRRHFQDFVEHLFETLRDSALAEDERYAVIARINTFADEVIGSGPTAVD